MIHSFLMMGQSNMAGRGLLREVEPIHNPSIRMLRNGRWQQMSEPINFDRPFAGVGPAASFALAWLKDNPGEEAGLIPCADGGSGLDEWMPGSSLFDHAVMQAKLAQRSSTIEGILWHQGETDCPSERVSSYKEHFRVMIAELRKQLHLPQIPVLVGGLGDYLPQCPLHDYYVNAPRMTEVLRELADEEENCYFVTAKGLEPNADCLHFNAVSQRIFGCRYYAAYAQRKHIDEPLPEQQMYSQQEKYVHMTIQEKQEKLQSLLAEGVLSRQEYDQQMDQLISSM